jgi:hypothetical protein
VRVRVVSIQLADSKAVAVAGVVQVVFGYIEVQSGVIYAPGLIGEVFPCPVAVPVVIIGPVSSAD